MIYKYFFGSTLSVVLGLPLCGLVGWYYDPTMASVLQALFIGAVLAVLEISLSFDNAIVNAKVLNEMTPVWRHRFLTWGMLIAVFGMRLVFPLAIVAGVAHINPVQAFVMAALDPKQYADIMLSAHHIVAAFGGSFLLMVALQFFYDENKEQHWIPWLEVPAVLMGRIEAIEMGICILVLVVVSRFVEPAEQFPFLVAGLMGLIVFQVVQAISAILESYGSQAAGTAVKSSAGLFIYLEVLDASFSFDGVVGAFAITNNLFIIMIGLSIGAFFVRSLTILLVDRQTLQEFAYLEHGAFYAIGALAVIMLSYPLIHVPEWVTGVSGAVILALALWSSLRVRKKMEAAKT